MTPVQLAFDFAPRHDREVRFLDWHPHQWQASVTDDGVARCCSTCRHHAHMTPLYGKPGVLRGYTCEHRRRDPEDTALLHPCGGWLWDGQ